MQRNDTADAVLFAGIGDCEAGLPTPIAPDRDPTRIVLAGWHRQKLRFNDPAATVSGSHGQARNRIRRQRRKQRSQGNPQPWMRAARYTIDRSGVDLGPHSIDDHVPLGSSSTFAASFAFTLTLSLAVAISATGFGAPGGRRVGNDQRKLTTDLANDACSVKKSGNNPRRIRHCLKPHAMALRTRRTQARAGRLIRLADNRLEG